MKNIILNVGGMTCSGCSARLEKYLNKQEGIFSASVNLVLATAKIEYDENLLDVNKLNKFIEESGFTSYGEEYNKNKRKPERFVLLIYTVLTILLMYISMGNMFKIKMPNIIDMHSNPIIYAVSLAVITFLYFIYGFDIIKSGIKNLVNKMPNMDSLIMIGVIVNYLYSLFNMILVFKGDMNGLHHLYFEASAMTILFVKIGRFIDKNNRIKATDAVKGLVSVTPKNAVKLVDGEEKTVTINEISKGDIIVCRPGEKIAVDGIVRKGRTNINEALITGESKPVHKEIGDEVIAGSINCNGYIEYEAVRIGRETNISNIVKMVVEATNSKTEIQKFVDKVSGIFVPAIFIIAVLASILNFVIIRDISIAVNVFVTVLVVACPCALGIATPLAMVVSIGKLSKNGIFIKSSESLEILKDIKNVVFDKTGTLTNGKFSIVEKNISDENMLILQSIEFNSKHPIAQSICEFSDFNKIEVTNFREIEGYGLQADIGNSTYYVGSLKFVKEQCINNIYGNDEEKFLSNGYTIVYLFNNDGVLGIVGLADTVKDGVKELIQELKNMNKNIYMLTGDNEAAAKIIANEIGIDNVESNLTPKQKLVYVSNMNDDTNSVMMVGDGINDSPSLKAAAIGVSVEGGSDVSADSSDIILMNSNIGIISLLLKVGKKTNRIIKQNLFWAVFYNCLMIVIATGLLPIHINPMIASMAMMMSSLMVVFNSLRLL
ncbi:MAG: cation-translocating P-type ATPase [Clostridiales bacterium]|nr:cation-translocating P-type ATPase [Clostridiales bacterium]